MPDPAEITAADLCGRHLGQRIRLHSPIGGGITAPLIDVHHELGHVLERPTLRDKSFEVWKPLRAPVHIVLGDHRTRIELYLNPSDRVQILPPETTPR